MIYMYFRRWRLTDSLLMADMSKVYIMRRGWTLCLDGIGLAISRSKVGHDDYQVIITVRKPDITQVEHQTRNQFESIGAGQRRGVKNGSGHFNLFHMTII